MDSVSRENNKDRVPKPGSPEAIEESRRIYRERVPERESLADELIEDRRRENELEELDDAWLDLPIRSVSREHNQFRRPKPGSPEAIAEMRRIFRSRVPRGDSLTAELIRERRAAAERE